MRQPIYSVSTVTGRKTQRAATSDDAFSHALGQLPPYRVRRMVGSSAPIPVIGQTARDRPGSTLNRESRQD